MLRARSPPRVLGRVEKFWRQNMARCCVSFGRDPFTEDLPFDSKFGCNASRAEAPPP